MPVRWQRDPEGVLAGHQRARLCAGMAKYRGTARHHTGANAPAFSPPGNHQPSPCRTCLSLPLHTQRFSMVCPPSPPHTTETQQVMEHDCDHAGIANAVRAPYTALHTTGHGGGRDIRREDPRPKFLGSGTMGAPQAQCARSATIWAPGRTRDPYFEILGAPRGIMVTRSGGF